MTTRHRTRILATGFLGGQALRALTEHPDAEPIAACRTPERLPGWFAGQVRQGRPRLAQEV
ncbi:hypothetical protein ACL02S_09995 [Nocardia sp. 004]|uniref:hypothetical protein n=1 Tax=Nocardia sp. 004 TaxID=3385978 RepID=UPI0039A0C16D